MGVRSQITIADMTDREVICVPGTVYVPVDADGKMSKDTNGQNERNFVLKIRQGGREFVTSEITNIKIVDVDNNAIILGQEKNGLTLTNKNVDRPQEFNLAWTIGTPFSGQIHYAITIDYNGYNLITGLDVAPDISGSGVYVEKIVRYYYTLDTTSEPTISPSVDECHAFFDDEKKEWSYSPAIYPIIEEDSNPTSNSISPIWNTAHGYEDMPYYFELYLYSDHVTAQVSDIYYDRALGQSQTNTSNFSQRIDNIVSNNEDFLNWFMSDSEGGDSDQPSKFKVGENIISATTNRLKTNADFIEILATEVIKQAVVCDENGFTGTFFEQTNSYFDWALLNQLSTKLMTFDEKGLHIADSNSRYAVLITNDGVYVQRKDDENKYITQSRFRKQQLTIPDIRIAYAQAAIDDAGGNRISMQLAPDNGTMFVLEKALGEEIITTEADE